MIAKGTIVDTPFGPYLCIESTTEKTILFSPKEFLATGELFSKDFRLDIPEGLEFKRADSLETALSLSLSRATDRYFRITSEFVKENPDRGYAINDLFHEMDGAIYLIASDTGTVIGDEPISYDDSLLNQDTLVSVDSAKAEELLNLSEALQEKKSYLQSLQDTEQNAESETAKNTQDEIVELEKQLDAIKREMKFEATSVEQAVIVNEKTWDLSAIQTEQQNVKKNTLAYPNGVTHEQILEARKVDLLTYLQSVDPSSIVKSSRNEYALREHDSFKISNGKWYWFSQGIGGRSALDYLVKIEKKNFAEAVKLLNREFGTFVPEKVERAEKTKEYEQNPKVFIAPRKAERSTRAWAYLVRTRKIDQALVSRLIRQGLIYQDTRNNVVFLGVDKDGIKRHASLRSTNTSSKFRMDASGSDKHYSFHFSPTAGKHERVIVTESPIDALSAATLCNSLKDGREAYYLSLSGTAPIALEQFLKDHAEIKQVVLALDQDEPGRDATEKIQAMLDGKYTTTQMRYRGKDPNEALQVARTKPQAMNQKKDQEEKTQVTGPTR